METARQREQGDEQKSLRGEHPGARTAKEPDREQAAGVDGGEDPERQGRLGGRRPGRGLKKKKKAAPHGGLGGGSQSRLVLFSAAEDPEDEVRRRDHGKEEENLGPPGREEVLPTTRQQRGLRQAGGERDQGGEGSPARHDGGGCADQEQVADQEAR